jgi:diaminopimelate decarboxylase
VIDPATAERWRARAHAAVATVGTPCYVVAAAEVERALAELASLPCPVPRRHWLSLKTQPMKALLELWHGWGFGVEVVSPFELDAALSTGMPPERILVNGAGKYHWLRDRDIVGLNVHFDSVTEAHALARAAVSRRWTVGLRCQVPGQNEPPDPDRLDQFGMTRDEIVEAANAVRAADGRVAGMHFHIRTNLGSAVDVTTAVEHVRVVCELASIEPDYIDVGGGLPVPGERPLDGGPSRATTFDLHAWAEALSAVPAQFSSVRELWLENGRFVTARAGILVVTILERKERGALAYVICDGGRTNHARMAAFAQHEMLADPDPGGPRRSTVVYGPTCTAVDRLGECEMPATLDVGDRILWMNAGAYHIPLETRLSFGCAPVVWCDLNETQRVVRERETSEEWWGQWL